MLTYRQIINTHAMYMTYEQILDKIKQSYPPADIELFKKAYLFARSAHHDQIRKSGEEYIVHPLAVAEYLANYLRVDMFTIVAGLLHDVPENTAISLDEIEKSFGIEVAFMVSGITKLGKIKLRNQKDQNYIETLRKMFLAMAADIRIVLIKLADRRHNMQTLSHLPPDKQLRIARETLEVYAPIADRLGMGELKGELEDLTFPYVYPKDFAWLKTLIADRYEKMTEYVTRAKNLVIKDFKNAGIPYLDISGRTKHLYSLYQKLLRPKYDKDIAKIYDLVALRIITKSLEDCYAALGILHSKYRPLPGRIKDYIAFPKPNGYRSLHTTVLGPDGQVLEVQIRTWEMHQEAEYGIAAHWAYSAKGKPENGAKLKHEQFEWVNQLRDWQKEHGGNAKEFMESLKIDFFKNRIFVLTPKGDVKDLPESATSLDFAFAVHTDLGTHAQGAKINGKIVKFSEELRNGDVVEILKSKEARVSRDWIRFVKTSNARGKIKTWLNQNQKGWFAGILPSFLNKK